MPEHLKWVPLESNPDLFNKWAKAAGLIGPDAPVFQDVLGLDDESLATVGHPVKAVILLFPDDVQKKRVAEETWAAEHGQPHLDPTIFYVEQTIDNACGTIALIHALANTDVALSPMKPLQKYLNQARDRTPSERAKLLETTTVLHDIHAQIAMSGQSKVDDDTPLHFICFVAAPDADFRERAAAAGEEDQPGQPDEEANDYISGMRLIELDGRSRAGPFDRGECTDLLKDAAKLVKEKYVGQSSSIDFSMIVLGGPPPETNAKDATK